MSTSCIPEKTNNKTKQDSNLRRDETKIQNKKDKSSHDKTRFKKIGKGTRQEQDKRRARARARPRPRQNRGGGGDLR